MRILAENIRRDFEIAQQKKQESEIMVRKELSLASCQNIRGKGGGMEMEDVQKIFSLEYCFDCYSHEDKD